MRQQSEVHHKRGSRTSLQRRVLQHGEHYSLACLRAISIVHAVLVVQPATRYSLTGHHLIPHALHMSDRCARPTQRARPAVLAARIATSAQPAAGATPTSLPYPNLLLSSRAAPWAAKSTRTVPGGSIATLIAAIACRTQPGGRRRAAMLTAIARQTSTATRTAAIACQTRHPSPLQPPTTCQPERSASPAAQRT